jgi:hypothetical protein
VVAGAVAVAAASNHSFALLGDGTALGWGDNHSGVLGDGGTEASAVPVPVSGLHNAVAIATSFDHSLALLGDGTVVAWGDNEQGQLGDGTTTSSHEPVEVKGLSGRVVAIAAGEDFSVALLEDGEVVAWGQNDEGELGSACGCSMSATPVAVSGLSGPVTAIAAGGQHTLALLATGTVEAWGFNQEGEVGDGTQSEKATAVAVHELAGVKSIAAGAGNSEALLENGEVRTWGRNFEGELGEGSGKSSLVPIPVGCALHAITGIAAGEDAVFALGEAQETCPQPLALSPDEATAGEEISIIGRGLGDATRILFGPNQTRSFTVVSPTEIRVVVPPGTGETAVVVKGKNGSSEAFPAPKFFYTGPVALGPLVPGSGPSAGGNSVGILGSELQRVESVTIGGNPAEILQQRFGALEVKVPPGHGIEPVTVMTSEGPITDKVSYVYEEVPEFGQCLSTVNASEFADHRCVTGTMTGSWVPIIGGDLPLTKPGVSWAVGRVKLETASHSVAVNCTAGTATGSYRDDHSLSISGLRLTGCRKGTTTSCSSAGAAAGEIDSAPLAVSLGTATDRTGLAVRVGPSEGATFAEFSCGATPVLVTGAAVLEISPAKKMAVTFVIKGTERAGAQAIKGFTSGPEEILHASVSGGPAEALGLKATAKQSNEEAVEID